MCSSMSTAVPGCDGMAQHAVQPVREGADSTRCGRRQVLEARLDQPSVAGLPQPAGEQPYDSVRPFDPGRAGVRRRTLRGSSHLAVLSAGERGDRSAALRLHPLLRSHSRSL